MFFPRGLGEDPDGFSLVAYSDSDWAGDRESRKSTSSGMIWWGPYLISDLVEGQSVVATSSGDVELYAAVSVMKDMMLIKRALSFIWLSAKMELRLDSSAACPMLERQGAGRVRHVAVLWAQQWVRDRGVAVRAEPTRTNCADLGTKVHSVARFRELFDMIRLRDRDDFEAEASKETLPVPLPVAGDAHSLSPLASLITFLSTLVVHGEARVIHETEAPVASSLKGQFSLDVGRGFQGMFLTVGIGILLGFAVGVFCGLARRKNPRVTWPSGLWMVVGGATLETWDEVCR